MSERDLLNRIAVISDFPKPGVQFRDITPVLADPEAFGALIQSMAASVPANTTKLVAIESRGFILGSALAQKLGLGLVLARKPGKLPRPTLKEAYGLEYGNDALEMHVADLSSADQVTVVDDVLATGGTALAAYKLCQQIEAKVLAFCFLLEISALQGRTRLPSKVISTFTV